MSALHAVPVAPDAAAELRRNARVLSAEGGPFPADKELRDKLCLLDNGELLIAQGAQLDMEVLSYKDLLKRANHEFKVLTASLSELRDYYTRQVSNQPAPDARETSSRQKQVLGLIDNARASGASDMHFIVRKNLAVLRNRVNGILETVLEMRHEDGFALVSTIYQSMCDQAEPLFNATKPQDARLKSEFFEAAGMYGARIATRPMERGLHMVLRLLYNTSNKRRSIDELGYLPEQLAMIRRMTKRKDGVNVFSGETGSGKSSSLEVCIRMLIEYYRNEINVITIEDPVEYEIPGANQTPKGPFPWADAIRNCMRMDPDVMMVGEVRDLASAEAALQGALTGHGLWTTTHAKDAVAILQRFGEFKDEAGGRLNPGLYTDHSLVTGLINQALVPVLCPHCKKAWVTSELRASDHELRERVEKKCEPENIFVKGPGCDACRRSGIAGRSVIAEVIVPTYEFMRTFRERGKTEARDYWIKEMRGITKIDHLARRINDGLVDPSMGEKKVGLLDEISQ